MNDAGSAIAPSTPRLTPCGDYFRKLNHSCPEKHGQLVPVQGSSRRTGGSCGSCDSFVEVDGFSTDAVSAIRSIEARVAADSRIDGRLRMLAWSSLMLARTYHDVVSSIKRMYKLTRGYSYCDRLP